jgi:ATP-dependent DNA helicase RecG
MFAARDVHSVADALFFIPRRYEDRRKVCTISSLKHKERACFVATVMDFGEKRIGRGRSVFEMMLADDSGQIVARWFNYRARSFMQRYQRGDRVQVVGQLELYRRVRQLVHPDIEKISSEEDDFGDDYQTIIPVYPEVEGIYPKVLRKIMRQVVEKYADMVSEILPASIRARHGLSEIGEALRQVHFPAQDADIEILNQGRSLAHRRVVFDEFFLLQLGLAIRRGQLKQNQGFQLKIDDDLVDLAHKWFGFMLTGGQKRVLAEVVADMGSEKPMNRLLQGDVGSGKTALAILAGIITARAGKQTAFMAPTEILAEQHYKQLMRLIQRQQKGIRIAFLTSSVKGNERSETLAKIAAGEVDLVVGTHALVEEKVEFFKLGLCVIDEQHRFGVLQRAKLRDKGLMPDVLVMTATPIPRTLAMTVYGDLDVSILDEMPPGRRPVKTIVLRGNKVMNAYKHVKQEVSVGGQAYIVYPLVDESEKMPLRDATRMFEGLNNGVFQGLRLGLLHGRLSSEEKEAVMAKFVAGELDVLISTTVIEVGVDVPNASLMVVEHAERFGLSQLHQLRGRVGRGKRQSFCYLIAHNMASDDARTRLKVMEATNDGFKIAEQDLALRGPGEFLGTRQSGLPTFVFGNLARDADLLAEARDEAFSLIQRDPNLSQPEHDMLRKALWVRWGKRLSLAEVG